MFSSAVSIGRRLKNWKMKPMCSRRSFVSSVSLSSAMLVPSMVTSPAVGLVEPREDVHEGRLAGARRAHDAGELSALDVEVDAAEGADGGVAFAVGAGDAARRHDGAVRAALSAALSR